MNNLTKKLLLAGASLSLVGSVACENSKQSEQKICTNLELYDGGQLIRNYDNVSSFWILSKTNSISFKDKEGLSHEWGGTYLKTDAPCK